MQFMKSRFLLAVLMFALMGVTAGCEQQAVVHADVAGPHAVIVQRPPPEEIVETLPPPPGPPEVWVWQKGHWRWNGADYVWTPGHWAQRPAGFREWVAPHWQPHPAGGYLFIEGHWQ